VASRIVVPACIYALVGWAVFTALVVALGNLLVPTISSPLAPLVVPALAGLTALVVAALTLDFLRRTGRDDVCAALVLGTCLASVGLALDAVLLLATEFDYPNVDADRTPTLAVLLLLGYAAAAAVPPLVAARRGRAGRESNNLLQAP
jgi:hypothetical protein